MPAPDLELCSPQDVLQFCFAGDAAEANKLVRAAVWSTDYLSAPIKASSSDVEAAAGNKFQLGYNPDVTTYPYHLRKLAALRAGYYTWVMYGRGMACPELLRREVTDPDLQILRDGKGGTGTQKAAASRVSSVHVVDVTVGGAVPRMTLGGFGRY